MQDRCSANDFKIAMHKYVYSVSIASNTTSENIDNAITISSFTSISVEPPSILVCINKGSRIHDSLMIGTLFCVNLLNDKQINIAELCAYPNQFDKRFDNKEWAVSNPPKLIKALVHLECIVDNIIEHKSHSIILGIVKKTNTTKEDNVLMYKDQKYI